MSVAHVIRGRPSSMRIDKDEQTARAVETAIIAGHVLQGPGAEDGRYTVGPYTKMVGPALRSARSAGSTRPREGHGLLFARNATTLPRSAGSNTPRLA